MNGYHFRTKLNDSRTFVRIGLLSESEFYLFGHQSNSYNSPTSGLMAEFEDYFSNSGISPLVGLLYELDSCPNSSNSLLTTLMPYCVSYEPC